MNEFQKKLIEKLESAIDKNDLDDFWTIQRERHEQVDEDGEPREWEGCEDRFGDHDSCLDAGQSMGEAYAYDDALSIVKELIKEENNNNA